MQYTGYPNILQKIVKRQFSSCFALPQQHKSSGSMAKYLKEKTGLVFQGRKAGCFSEW